jgi:hypothetical protein
MAPRQPQDGPKTAQNGSKTAPRLHKAYLRTAPRWPKTAPSPIFPFVFVAFPSLLRVLVSFLRCQLCHGNCSLKWCTSACAMLFDFLCRKRSYIIHQCFTVVAHPCNHYTTAATFNSLSTLSHEQTPIAFGFRGCSCWFNSGSVFGWILGLVLGGQKCLQNRSQTCSNKHSNLCYFLHTCFCNFGSVLELKSS